MHDTTSASSDVNFERNAPFERFADAGAERSVSLVVRRRSATAAIALAGAGLAAGSALAARSGSTGGAIPFPTPGHIGR